MDKADKYRKIMADYFKEIGAGGLAGYRANLTRFGWKEDKIEEFFRTWHEYHMERIKNPQKDFMDHNLEVGFMLVIVGQKK